MSQSSKTTSFPFLFSKATRAHEKHPERNEDALLTDQACGLAMVCDGVGSAIGAGPAASLATRTIKQHWKRQWATLTSRPLPTARELNDIFCQLLEQANNVIRLAGEQLAQNRTGTGNEEQTKPEKKIDYSQTTIVLALLLPKPPGYLLGYAHVGDSRIYLLRPGEALQRLTSDDGYFLRAIQKGEMSEQDAWRIEQASSKDQLSEAEHRHFEKRNGITQALGDEKIICHSNQIVLTRGDRILLCTDGIHDNLTDAEIETTLRSSKESTAARTLLNQALKRSRLTPDTHLRAKKDDMSALVITYRDLSLEAKERSPGEHSFASRQTQQNKREKRAGTIPRVILLAGPASAGLVDRE